MLTGTNALMLTSPVSNKGLDSSVGNGAGFGVAHAPTLPPPGSLSLARRTGGAQPAHASGFSDEVGLPLPLSLSFSLCLMRSL